jgi:hypothetical protein
MESGLQVQSHSQLNSMMDRGGFSLRKWSSNCPELLNSLPAELRESNTTTTINMDISVKTLGVHWNTHLDQFQFRIDHVIDPAMKYTKRKILLDISKIFDPLGWLSPVISSAKMMMQEVWKADIGWDELVTGTLLKEWLEFLSNLTQLSLITIPRCILPKTPSSIHVAGFCDASEKAYGVVGYTCAYFHNSKSVISIITARIKRLVHKQIGPITPAEVNDVLITWVKNIQQQYFPAELHNLQQQKELLTSSKLLQLHPFLDKDGVIRVGGRLSHAKISSDARNPILIPKSSHLTSLLIMSTHLENELQPPQMWKLGRVICQPSRS